MMRNKLFRWTAVIMPPVVAWVVVISACLFSDGHPILAALLMPLGSGVVMAGLGLVACLHVRDRAVSYATCPDGPHWCQDRLVFSWLLSGVFLLTATSRVLWFGNVEAIVSVLVVTLACWPLLHLRESAA